MEWLTDEDFTKAKEELRGFARVGQFRLDDRCGVFCEIMENTEGDRKYVVRNYRRGGKAEYFLSDYAATQRLTYLSSAQAIADENLVRYEHERNRIAGVGQPALHEQIEE
ncbi:MAG: hypothetical protein PHI12_07975 [Dehalococcoidales bacterium]|jgi:hypothetical protein|nr:hypothetical protein [Sphaerochaeta sp.]MDD5510731.1 hypothetical protein [Dehalococcoidales bacterium]